MSATSLSSFLCVGKTSDTISLACEFEINESISLSFEYISGSFSLFFNPFSQSESPFLHADSRLRSVASNSFFDSTIDPEICLSSISFSADSMKIFFSDSISGRLRNSLIKNFSIPSIAMLCGVKVYVFVPPLLFSISSFSFWHSF